MKEGRLQAAGEKKNEHRTLNIEHRTSKKKKPPTNTER